MVDYSIGYMTGKEDSEREFKKKVQEWYEKLITYESESLDETIIEIEKYLRES